MKMTLRHNGGKKDLNDGVGLSLQSFIQGSFKDTDHGVNTYVYQYVPYLFLEECLNTLNLCINVANVLCINLTIVYIFLHLKVKPERLILTLRLFIFHTFFDMCDAHPVFLMLHFLTLGANCLIFPMLLSEADYQSTYGNKPLQHSRAYNSNVGIKKRSHHCVTRDFMKQLQEY